jgi:hypothetical protein
VTDPAKLEALKKSAGLVVEALSLCLVDAGDRPRPYRGIIPCPKCGGDLHYLAKSTARGTIWGTCATPNCLTWMV